MDPTKRECILVEAAKAFARWGFKKTSVDDIAKAAGVAKGTIYLASESKEDLFFQVVQREVRAWVAEIVKMIDPRVPADDLLLRMSTTALGYLDTHPLVQDLLFGKTSELLPTHQDRVAELRAAGATHVIEVLKLGIRQGVFRPDLDCEAVASLLQDLQITTYIFHNRGPDKEAKILRRGTAALDLVLNGLRTPEAKTRGVPRLPSPGTS
jgi:AcrR family transcriptional regulator